MFGVIGATIGAADDSLKKTTKGIREIRKIFLDKTNGSFSECDSEKSLDELLLLGEKLQFIYKMEKEYNGDEKKIKETLIALKDYVVENKVEINIEIERNIKGSGFIGAIKAISGAIGVANKDSAVAKIKELLNFSSHENISLFYNATNADEVIEFLKYYIEEIEEEIKAHGIKGGLKDILKSNAKQDSTSQDSTSIKDSEDSSLESKQDELREKFSLESSDEFLDNKKGDL